MSEGLSKFEVKVLKDSRPNICEILREVWVDKENIGIRSPPESWLS